MSIIKLKTLKYFALKPLSEKSMGSPRDATFAQISYKYNNSRKVEKNIKDIVPYISRPIHFRTIFCL